VEKITLTINNRQVEAEPGMTVLEAARQAGVHIPTLCYHRDLAPEGHCRVCLVEIEGQRTLQPACNFPAANGMEVSTHSHAVRDARRLVVELLLSNHPNECLTCVRSRNCELQALAKEMGIRETRFEGDRTVSEVDESSFITRDNEKCVLCRRCVRVCQGVQSVAALSAGERGWETVVGPAFGREMADVICVNCGQCINYCPTGALRERDSIQGVWTALRDPDKFVVVQTAPAVRVGLGEDMGMAHGALVTGKMVAALRELGFDRIFDTDFTADLTIMEEGNELIKRVSEGGELPIITSCCPGWIKFAEHFYPDLLDNLSTCKSPQQMFGAIAKTYYAEKAGVDPAKMVVVSIMPCTAKKFECERPEMNSSGYKDVDFVLTTRELAQMLRESSVDLSQLPEEDYDDPLGQSTGAAVIFGATGGVMEAALRTAYEVITGQTLDNVDFEAVRGLEGIKEATIPVGDLQVKVAVTHTLGKARQLLDQIRAGKSPYHFIEVMACPGGCLAGGGQPIPVNNEIRMARAKSIYQADAEMPIRKSHESPVIKVIYEEFLKEPLGHKSHELLHTHYTPRPAEAPQKLQEAEGGNGKSATGAAKPAAAKGA
jgi:NADH-quinone oxidoreductase subunit G/NADP-reducing hydrogenase subunit HndD